MTHPQNTNGNLSKCCKSPIVDALSLRNIPEEERSGQTNWLLCSNCHKACDTVSPSSAVQTPMTGANIRVPTESGNTLDEVIALNTRLSEVAEPSPLTGEEERKSVALLIDEIDGVLAASLDANAYMTVYPKLSKLQNIYFRSQTF